MKKEITKRTYDKWLNLHRSTPRGYWYTNAVHVWANDTITGTQNYSHDSYGIPGIQVEYNRTTGERRYFKFV